MTLKDLTKKIQRLAGATADGIYGKNTAHAIIDALENGDNSSKKKPTAKKVTVSLRSVFDLLLIRVGQRLPLKVLYCITHTDRMLVVLVGF
jgi:hypothetical protein